MANVKVKVRNDANTDWIQLYPEITVDQITDATTLGKNIIKEQADSGSNTFLRVNSDGTVTKRTGEQLRQDAGAPSSNHNHTILQITGLEGVLEDKADLDVNGHVLASQIPSWVLGGKRFKNIVIETAITLNTTWFNNNDLTTGEGTWGYYFIITDASGCAVTFNSSDVEFTAGGDEGDATSPIQLNQGDWLVYSRYENSKWIFSVINNRYDLATQNARGVVRIATPGTRKLRSELDNAVNANKIIDEAALRVFMKDIHRGSVSPTAVEGDLWLHETT